MSATTEISVPPWSNSEITNLANSSFFATMEASAAGTLATDQSGVIVWINERYCRLLGCGASHLLGRPIASVLPGTRLPEVLRSGHPIVLDVMRHEGCEFLVSRFPVFNHAQKIIGAYGFVLNNPKEDPVWTLDHAHKSRSGQKRLADRGDPSRLANHPSSFIGRSAHAERVRLLAKKCAGTNAPVLITGPTGCGKEVVAQTIHRDSFRQRGNFVAVNAGAIPEALFEAEFFGSAPGAYTGADRHGRPGKLQLADGGTLFLDELGDMPHGAQVKLLRFLETGEYEPLGSNQLRRADVRLIAATSVDLRAAISSRSFRADLYYRLAVFPIAIAALKDRAEDIPEISEALIEQINGKYGGNDVKLLPCAKALLQSYEWPGNVRELRNLLERSAIFAGEDPIDRQLIVEMTDQVLVRETTTSKPSQVHRSLAKAVADLEAQEIALALASCNGSTSQAARRLEISRTTLYKKAKQYGFDIGDARGS